MAETPRSDLDIHALLERMRPPSIPDEVFSPDNTILLQITSWRKLYVASILSGLLTEPQYHANGIRLDWLQRLVLSKSDGRRKPTSAGITRVLNAGLEQAGVLRLEDPSEDRFCETLSTTNGTFRIFPGQWEGAGPYTETLIDAFHRLPEGDLKQAALTTAYNLLKLSDALAARAGIDAFTASQGDPMGSLRLPGTTVLEHLARRVKFTDTELEELGINEKALSPFFLKQSHYQFVSDRPIGDTPLEFYPLVRVQTGIAIISPANISLAVRAVLIQASQSGGMDGALLHTLMRVQEEYSESSGFWPVTRLRLSPPHLHNLRAAMCEFAPGRYLHVIQLPVTFDGFPRHAFASVRSLGEEASKFIGADVSRFWRFLSQRPDCRQAVTVLLFSGWGAAHSVAPVIDEGNEPPYWQFLMLSFADAAVLGACENGKFKDLCRILQQEEKLAQREFELSNMNGILNLFGFWRSTDGNLVPEHMREIVPPVHIALPTDSLLAPRIESAKKRDRRSFPHPEGGFRHMQRMDWGEEEDLKPIYASLDDIGDGLLLGAIDAEGRTWWLGASANESENREWIYRVWHAVLQWLAAVATKLIKRYPDTFLPRASGVNLALEQGTPFMGHAADGETPPLSQTLNTTTGVVPTVHISMNWFRHLWTPDNDAETELIAAVLEGLQARASPLERNELRQAIQDAIGSKDWRWMHARPVTTPVDQLGALGLTGSFKEIRLSATALAKCGSTWELRTEQDGLEIKGSDDCKKFLTVYRDHILTRLIKQIRQYNRKQLVLAAAETYQASRLEQSSWRATIHALRAIHGREADIKAFKRQNAMNAVQRAAKVVCEIAACEAPSLDGLKPSFYDLEEMYANALLLFGNSQLFAAIRVGLIEPTLRLSPAGDLLSERSIFETTLRPGAEWANTNALNESAASYRRVRSSDAEPETQAKTLNEDLRVALEAEYHVPMTTFANFQYAVIELAEERAEAVFTMRRSELAAALGKAPGDFEGDLQAFLKRLTLPKRERWLDRSAGLSESDIDLGRFDRPFSIINRPLLALDDADDPEVLLAPMFASDGTMYSFSGLMEGTLQGKYWSSVEAISYAGARADASGNAFEETVAARLRDLELEAFAHRSLSWALNEKVDPKFGNIDVLVVNRDRSRVWIIEAKSLKLCRTEGEVANRLAEYRGRSQINRKGKEEPDKLLRHINRVQYIRERSEALRKSLKLPAVPEVRGLLIVDAPQPMNFHMLEKFADAQSAYFDVIGDFQF
jgi:hypothetical protein